MNGPDLGGYGFWQGAEPETICAQVTNVPSSHWLIFDDECANLIARRFAGFMTIIYACIYLTTIASFYSWGIWNIGTICRYCSKKCKIK
jgi:hypothetical protein